MTKKELQEQNGGDLMLNSMAQAVASGKLDADAIGKILDAQKVMLAMQAEQDFNRAYVELRGSIPPIYKNKRGYNSSYATLDYIEQAVKRPLKKHGFSYYWDTEVDLEKKSVKATCYLVHASGHCKQASFTAPIEVTSKQMNSTQAGASASSYARRYSLSYILGISTTEDDNDANFTHATIDQSQIETIQIILKSTKTDLNKFLNFAGVERLEDITNKAYPRIMASLKKKAGK